MAVLDEFFEACRSKRVASFDVFDTALWRRVAQPTHIFALAEQELCERFGTEVGQDFAQARVDAERLARELGAREHGHVEVTLDEIYDALPRFWPRPPAALSHARTAELTAELENVEAEPAIKAVYDRLKALNVRTIFVSDIYLDEQSVRNLLAKCGYDSEDPLFVSSEYRKAKWDGSIWPVVAKRLRVRRRDIVHVGDNQAADIDAAIRSGVAAFHWPGRSRHHKPFAPVSRWIAPLSRLKSLNQGVRGASDNSEPSWIGLGRSYGAIIFGSFLRWIAERVGNGVDHVYFCSRDGQILLKLWRELIEPGQLGPTASYLHVSRRTLMLPLLDAASEQGIEFLQSGMERRSVRTYLERAALLDSSHAVARAEALFGSLDKVIETAEERRALEDFFRSSGEELADVARAHREMAERYLRQEGLFDGGHRVIVDLGWRGNLQRSIAELLARNDAPTVISGLYYGLTREAGVNRGSAGWMEAMIANDFMDRVTDLRLRQMVTILEQLHSADHGSVWSYAVADGHVGPVCRDSEVEQSQYRDKILPFQHAAEVELREIFAGVHSIAPEQLNANSAWDALVELCLFPSREEARLLGGLRTLDGFEHSGAGVPIAAALPTPSRQDAEDILRGHVWVAGAFKNWLADHPEMHDTVRDLARRQELDRRWASQFS